MSIFKYFIGLLFLFITLNLEAQIKIDNNFGNGIVNLISEDSSYSMKIGLRFQTLFENEWEVDNVAGLHNNQSNFLIRRARLKFDGFAFSPRLKYKVELGLTNNDIAGISMETKNAPRMILDAVIKWNFAGNFNLWVGQTKLPGNRERVISSGSLQFVDRSLLNSKYNIDRDIGIQLHHYFTIGKQFLVREKLSLSQGEGRDITVGNLGGYDYTGRLEFLPFGAFTSKGDYFGSDLKREPKPKLSIGITYDFNDRAVREQGQLKDFMRIDSGTNYFEATLSTVFIDLMFKYCGFSFMAEYADKTADDPIVKNTDGTLTGDMYYVGKGLSLESGYLLKNNVEIAARYTAIIPEKITNRDQYAQYTLGFSKYFVGHKLKIQSDISYLVEENNPDDELLFRMQVELHF